MTRELSHQKQFKLRVKTIAPSLLVLLTSACNFTQIARILNKSSNTVTPTIVPSATMALSEQDDVTSVPGVTPTNSIGTEIFDEEIPMTLMIVSEAEARGAVCNDGTSAAYYLRRGVGEGSRLWVFHLQGGGYCFDRESCDARKIDKTGLTTSNGMPSFRPGNGVHSTSLIRSAGFFNANHVFVHYCSSDVWSGDRAASNETGGMHFRGARILRAVIDDLTNPTITPAPNMAQATHVLFSGSSAGGVGVLVHLDWLANRLPEAKVRGMTDAGWLINITPYGNTIGTPLQSAQLAHAFWNGTVDADCAAANFGEEGRCYLGGFVYPYISTTLFVQIAQFDAPQLAGLGITMSLDANERAYVAEFGAAIRESLDPVAAAFSPATSTHGLLMNAKFWTITIEGTPLVDVLGNWFFNRPGPTKLIEK